jgi:hypothetical protein
MRQMRAIAAISSAVAFRASELKVRLSAEKKKKKKKKKP